MSTQVTTAFVQDYRRGVDLLVQQGDSRLRNSVDVEFVGPGKQAFFDQVGATYMTERTTRHATTSYTDTPHARRMVPLRDYDVADLIDDPDKVRLLNDPTNAYSQAFAMAVNRQIDDTIIAAAVGTAYTGEDGTTTEALSSGQKVTGTVFTLARMLAIKQNFDENEVPDGDRHIILHAQAFADMLDITEMTSSDYVTIRALVHGEINTFLGFEFHRSERLLTTSSDDQCFAWHKSGIKLAIGKESVGRITEMPNLRYSTQVFYSITLGATRMEDEKVYELRLDS